jgi:hypothetical protein
VRGVNERMVKHRNHGSDEKVRGNGMNIKEFVVRLTSILMVIEAAH